MSETDVAQSPPSGNNSSASASGVGSALRNYLFAGILVTVPVFLTAWLSWRLFTVLDRRMVGLFNLGADLRLPWMVPGFGLLSVVVGLILIGFLATTFAGRALAGAVDRVMIRLPVLRRVYRWIKQVLDTLLGRDSTAFRQVVLIEYPQRGSWAIGFITSNVKGEVEERLGKSLVSVFVPATPNPTTGFLLFLPSDEVRCLDVSLEEGIKLVMSGGVLTRREIASVPSMPAGHETFGSGQPRGLAGRLRGYLVAGILVTVPVGISCWMVWTMVRYVDTWVLKVLAPFDLRALEIPLALPGIGVLLVAGGLLLVGAFALGFAGRTLIGVAEQVVAKVPVVRSIYAAFKQILEVVLSRKAEAFRRVVLFEYPRPGSWTIGFQTGIGDRAVRHHAGEVIGVFLPTTPNPTSGFLLYLPSAKTIPLSMSVEDGLKLVVSGGLASPLVAPPRLAKADPGPRTLGGQGSSG